jgi:hypothetical protein
MESPARRMISSLRQCLIPQHLIATCPERDKSIALFQTSLQGQKA